MALPSLSTLPYLAPISMALSFILALLFITTHHLFYTHLASRPTSSGPFFSPSSPISKQEANIALGTALAFLVKACLVYAVGVGGCQVFWREVGMPVSSRRDRKEGGKDEEGGFGGGVKLERLDAMHSVFNSVLGVGDVRLWWRVPALVGVAWCAWLIPIASIITPATLSIQTAAVTPEPSKLMRVPNLDFRSLNFVASLPYMHTFSPVAPTNVGTYLYNGPSQDVLEIANAVMSGGKILRIDSPAPNASWTVDFTGPALKCSELNETAHKLFQRNIVAGTLNGNVATNTMLYGYLAWNAHMGWFRDESLVGPPFLAESEHDRIAFAPGQFPGSTLDGNITFYMVAMPDVFGASQSAVHSLQSPGSPYPSWIDGTMIECTLYSSEYQVAFQYTDGGQEVAIEHPSSGEDEVVKVMSTLLGPNADTQEPDGCATGNVSASMEEGCYTKPKVLSTFSYQAVMDAFTSNLIGAVSIDGHSVLQRNSSVLSTSLLRTKELDFLRATAEVMVFGNETLQAQIADSSQPKTQGLLKDEDDVSSQPLAVAIEQMFENLTISLMSSGALQPNYSSAYAPSPVKVTLPAFQNIYVYSALKLWIAYGAAVGLAALAAAIGCVTMFLNGACYSNNFSTIFRAARGAEIDHEVREEDLKGQDPLPKYLAEARVRFDMVAIKEDDQELLRYRRQDSRFKKGTTASVRYLSISPDSLDR
ncbi:uncharacterized protein LTR77_006398 [Saxophila tyrrhenica]|uniref:Uncharacterized protein n=1 Tax=Saxophila tyrrhenica TaxID=1690608 RepID=A0AAV9PB85_9PEZI|nr:hypothetical protein LTR77_006398 [Saxophila tyrrhenica]